MENATIQSKPGAVGLLSGGLDSSLAAKLMKDVGVHVTLLHLKHIFLARPKVKTPQSRAQRIAEELGVDLIEREVSDELIPIVIAPRFGHGKHLNPCIDCHILFLQKAKEEMERIGANFVFSGEVLGQRPMSQHRGALRQVEKQAGVEGILLRPLSAKLLEPTSMEESGLVDRERLLDISGRSRNRQFALAEEWGVHHFSAPAGGCLLTDPEFTKRLIALMSKGTPTRDNIELLHHGRHFRIDDSTTVVVGRSESDNSGLSEAALQEDILLFSVDPPGPLVLLRGNTGSENLKIAAQFQKRYGKARDTDSLTVRYRLAKQEDSSGIDVTENVSEEFMDRTRIC